MKKVVAPPKSLAESVQQAVRPATHNVVRRQGTVRRSTYTAELVGYEVELDR